MGDFLDFVNVSFGPLTTEPTAGPSNDPTASPSPNPTTSPTMACDAILVIFTNFDVLSIDDVVVNTSIQQSMANITHSAIAESASGYGIDSDSFSVEFLNVSGDLTVEYILCSTFQGTLNNLYLVIENDEDDISTYIEENMTASFGTGSDVMTVSITFDEDNKFCNLHWDSFYSPRVMIYGATDSRRRRQSQ